MKLESILSPSRDSGQTLNRSSDPPRPPFPPSMSNIVFGVLFRGSVLRHRIPVPQICDKNPGLTQAALTPLTAVGLTLTEMIAWTVTANTYWPLSLREEQRESFALIGASHAHSPMKTAVNLLSDRRNGEASEKKSNDLVSSRMEGHWGLCKCLHFLPSPGPSLHFPAFPDIRGEWSS